MHRFDVCSTYYYLEGSKSLLDWVIMAFTLSSSLALALARSAVCRAAPGQRVVTYVFE
jgi:hypothetical protein